MVAWVHSQREKKDGEDESEGRNVENELSLHLYRLGSNCISLKVKGLICKSEIG